MSDRVWNFSRTLSGEDIRRSAMSKSVHCVALLFCLTFVLPHFPIVSSDANSKLKKCCSKLNSKTDDKYCVERFCDFDAISQANVLNFMSTCKDRGETVGHMWDCASSRVDHTKCCKEKGVSKTCMAYCSAQDGVPNNYIDYALCVENFNEIRDCFKDYLDAH
uniref:Domain of unknown function DB domain-containing protein n=1 Tax=Globodera rostochiensis TaxID=31243 RepID=A0A914HPR1_GLORO